MSRDERTFYLYVREVLGFTHLHLAPLGLRCCCSIHVVIRAPIEGHRMHLKPLAWDVMWWDVMSCHVIELCDAMWCDKDAFREKNGKRKGTSDAGSQYRCRRPTDGQGLPTLPPAHAYTRVWQNFLLPTSKFFLSSSCLQNLYVICLKSYVLMYSKGIVTKIYDLYAGINMPYKVIKNIMIMYSLCSQSLSSLRLLRYFQPTKWLAALGAHTHTHTHTQTYKQTLKVSKTCVNNHAFPLFYSIP